MADDEQCTDYQFKSPFLPGESCEGIYNKNPESHTKSGYYWILSREYCGMAYTGSSCESIYTDNPETGGKSGYYRINGNWKYCNMKEMTFTEITVLSTVSPTTTATATSLPVVSPTPVTGHGDFIPSCAGVGGQWKRIANINISAGDECPGGWHKDTYDGINFCRTLSNDADTCSSAVFSTNGTSYQRVCGRARGYQKGLSDAFWGYYVAHFNIDHASGYADGLLITYGSPRNHIWSYVNGHNDDGTRNDYNCPCADGNPPPPFVGTNYYCESGSDTRSTSAYYFSDPLWDGAGCITSRCCDNYTQPWFYRQLNETTTSDIEARICHDNPFVSGSTLVDQLELYIQ